MRKKIQENGWEVLSLQLFFRIFWLTEIYNPLDYFRVGQIFFPSRNVDKSVSKQRFSQKRDKISLSFGY